MKFKFIIFVFAIVCAAILYFDFWIYKIFVFDIESGSKVGGIDVTFLLKTPLLEKSSEEIKQKDSFLQNPKYPLIKNSF